MSRVNIVKRIKIGGRWKMFSIPRNAKGNYDWNAIADGRYYVEWYAGGTRRRVSAGVTAQDLLVDTQAVLVGPGMDSNHKLDIFLKSRKLFILQSH